MPQIRKTEAVWIEARGRWQINVQANGKRKTFTSINPGKRGKAEAERKADEWLENGQKENPRFDVAWAEFITSVKDSSGTSNYKNLDSMGRNWITPALGKKKLADITLQDMQDIIIAAAKKGKSRKTCKNIRGALTVFHAYARRNRYDMERPVALTVPNYAPVSKRDILQPRDLRTLFAENTLLWREKPVPAWYIHAWRFLVLTGLRPGEAYGLRKEDIDENGVIHVRRALNTYNEETHGKNDNAQRWFVLPKQAREVLADQEEQLKSAGVISPWVFPDVHGKATKQGRAYKDWVLYRKSHGITSSPYELRHTMISVVSASVPDKLIKKVAGHSASMDTQGIYSHEIDGEAQRAAELIEGAFDELLK